MIMAAKYDWDLFYGKHDFNHEIIKWNAMTQFNYYKSYQLRVVDWSLKVSILETRWHAKEEDQFYNLKGQKNNSG